MLAGLNAPATVVLVVQKIYTCLHIYIRTFQRLGSSPAPKLRLFAHGWNGRRQLIIVKRVRQRAGRRQYLLLVLVLLLWYGPS